MKVERSVTYNLQWNFDGNQLNPRALIRMLYEQLAAPTDRSPDRSG